MILIIGDSLIRINNSVSKVSKKINTSLIEIQKIHDSINETTSTPNALISPATYLFINDSLIYWSSDAIEPYTLNNISSERNIIKQANTIFYVSCKQNDSLKLFLATPLYRDNPNIQNDNKFLPENINGNYYEGDSSKIAEKYFYRESEKEQHNIVPHCNNIFLYPDIVV